VVCVGVLVNVWVAEAEKVAVDVNVTGNVEVCVFVGVAEKVTGKVAVGVPVAGKEAVAVAVRVTAIVGVKVEVFAGVTVVTGEEGVDGVDVNVTGTGDTGARGVEQDQGKTTKPVRSNPIPNRANFFIG